MNSLRLAALVMTCWTFGCGERSAPPSGPAAPHFQQEGAPVSLADGAAHDFFGYAVALSGSTALVGAPRRAVADRAEQGAAFVYVKSGPEWRLQATLTADDGGGSDHFGL